MREKELKLDDFKVKSFVTRMQREENHKVRGGATQFNCSAVDTCWPRHTFAC